MKKNSFVGIELKQDLFFFYLKDLNENETTFASRDFFPPCFEIFIILCMLYATFANC